MCEFVCCRFLRVVLCLSLSVLGPVRACVLSEVEILLTQYESSILGFLELYQ